MIVLNIDHLPVIHPDQNSTKVGTLGEQLQSVNPTSASIIYILLFSLLFIIKPDHLVLKEDPPIVDVLLAELAHLHQSQHQHQHFSVCKEARSA